MASANLERPTGPVPLSLLVQKLLKTTRKEGAATVKILNHCCPAMELFETICDFLSLFTLFVTHTLTNRLTPQSFLSC